MALKLIAPGKRKRNRFYLIRGRLNNTLYEFSAETTDKVLAQRRMADLTSKILLAAAPERLPIIAIAKKAKPRTFSDVADLYADFKNPSRHWQAIINRLCSQIGSIPVGDVCHADLVKAAKVLYPGCKNSTLNKSIITPASAILRYAAENQWRSHKPLARFKEEEPETKALRPEQVVILCQAARSNKALFALLVFLFNQGLRISDTLALRWKRVSLKAGIYWVRIGKSDKWKVKKLHKDTVEALLSLAEDGCELEERVFPYADRFAVRSALKPIVVETGVSFSPHVARHTLGFRLGKVSMKTRMDIMEHKSERSSLRYDMSQIPEQETAFEEIGSIFENVGTQRGDLKKIK